MAKKRPGGLGKGLGSLFEDAPETMEESGGINTLSLREIEPDPNQPRKNFDQDALAALADSLAEHGMLQPIAVRPKPAGTGYIIIAGERRWRAARMAGMDEVPVIIREVTEEQAAALALIENLQREDLDPIEEAEGCRQLVERFGLTQEDAAKRIGKSRSALANSLRLLALPDPVREQLRIGALSVGHAKALLGLPTPELMEDAAAAVVDKGLNVRQTEILCKRLMQPVKPEKIIDEFTRPTLAVEVEAALKDVIGSEVKVDYKGGKGTLRIDFYSDEQLRQYAGLLGQYKVEEAEASLLDDPNDEIQ